MFNVLYVAKRIGKHIDKPEKENSLPFVKVVPESPNILLVSGVERKLLNLLPNTALKSVGKRHLDNFNKVLSDNGL